MVSVAFGIRVRVPRIRVIVRVEGLGVRVHNIKIFLLLHNKGLFSFPY